MKKLAEEVAAEIIAEVEAIEEAEEIVAEVAKPWKQAEDAEAEKPPISRTRSAR